MFVVANIVLLSILCSSGRGGSGSGGRPAVIFMHANCDGYTALDRDLEEAAAGAACEDVRACYDTAFDLTAIAAVSITYLQICAYNTSLITLLCNCHVFYVLLSVILYNITHVLCTICTHSFTTTVCFIIISQAIRCHTG